jgi:hypothetical protein
VKRVQMGYKMRTPRVQIFVGYLRSKWGAVPPNGVRMAALVLTDNVVIR